MLKHIKIKTCHTLNRYLADKDVQEEYRTLAARDNQRFASSHLKVNLTNTNRIYNLPSIKPLFCD